MSLDARVVVERDRFTLDAAVSVGDGETLAVLGPNGAGKTTLLRALAGLVPITKGAISLDGTVLDDPARDVFVAPERRPVGFVFQDYLLFPNMSVIENVAFGLRARGTERDAARTRATELLEWVGLGEHAEKKPGAISGGQAQRVALARAMAVSPRLLLLDEPLAALDVTTRRSVRADLSRLLNGVDSARILVTHDPRDARVLADRMVIVENGRVVQSGTFDTIAANPATPYVHELLGDLQ
ncbi:MAG: ABC transporter ATP-binding protein [Ilumatobacteraceae bacterium]